MNDEYNNKLTKDDINKNCANCKRLEKELNEINNKLVYHSNLVFQLRKIISNFDRTVMVNTTPTKKKNKNNTNDFKVPNIIIEDC